jgi:hypothetical protein
MALERSPDEESPLVIGWREWIALPSLGIEAIKVKTDTGARTSALHADSIQRFQSRGHPMLAFVVHPLQRERGLEVRCEAELLDERWIRSSHGDQQLRPVIRTDIEIRGVRWAVEVTLTRRDVMGFRMLLGREAMRGHLLVDPGRSYLGNPSPWKRKKRKKRRVPAAP